MGSDMKTPANVDGAVEAYLMLLVCEFVLLELCLARKRARVTVYGFSRHLGVGTAS